MTDDEARARGVADELLGVAYDRAQPLEARLRAALVWLDLTGEGAYRDAHGGELVQFWLCATEHLPGGSREGRPLMDWEEASAPAGWSPSEAA